MKKIIIFLTFLVSTLHATEIEQLKKQVKSYKSMYYPLQILSLGYFTTGLIRNFTQKEPTKTSILFVIGSIIQAVNMGRLYIEITFDDRLAEKKKRARALEEEAARLRRQEAERQEQLAMYLRRSTTMQLYKWSIQGAPAA